MTESRRPLRFDTVLKTFDMKSIILQKITRLLVLAFCVALGRPAEAKDLLNLDKKGLAVQGYDVVAFFTDGKPAKGNSAIASVYRGATCLFATAEHKAAFDADPAKFEPVINRLSRSGTAMVNSPLR